MIYLSLFAFSFLAASILPISSELTLVSLLSSGNYNSLALLFSASLGNILGSVLNWFLGYYLIKHVNKKKRGNILQLKSDFNDTLLPVIKNNDFLMIKGSNATGLNELTKKLTRTKSNAL